MVDLETHRIVDMIDSRELSVVTQWLKTYPNLQFVSRDGSITYRNAIKQAHPNAVQVSDRFHLIKNLIDYGKDHLKKTLQQRIKIPIEQTETPVTPITADNDIDVNRTLTLQEKYERLKQLLDEGYTKTRICKILNMDVRAYDKLITATPEELALRFQTKESIVHEERVERKTRLVNDVRKLKDDGFGIRQITRQTGLSRRTINRYLDKDFNPVHAAYGKKRGSMLAPYMDEINRMAAQGLMGTVIEKSIREKGYTGSSSTLKGYISDWKKYGKHICDEITPGQQFQLIERKNVFKLLYHSLEDVKEISQAQFDSLCKEYPSFESVYNVISRFKAILKSKDSSELQPWIDSTRSMNISELNSFIEGINRDLMAVMNSIKFPFSNGLAEGTVNKIKVIKRIMYGRCSFKTLRNKTICLERFRKYN